MYAYENNLKPGGRLVAIMSEHPFFANDKASKDFREFLDEVGYSQQLPQGSFKESDRSTGVNTRLVVMDKPSAQTESQTYRYYLTQRPPAPGAIPRGSKNTVSFDTKQEVDGLEAWGYVEYDKPLTEQQISDYELTENSEMETPDKVHVLEATLRRLED